VASKFLYLIRHGQYQVLGDSFYRSEWEQWVEDLIKKDGGLTEDGIKQAKLIAKRLSAYPIDIIYSSILPRAIETAKYIAESYTAKKLSIEQVADLLECSPWVSKEISEQHGDVMTKEEIESHRQHADNTFEKFFKPHTGDVDWHEVLVCHGDLIRYLVTKIIETKTDYWIKLKVYNCGLSIIEIKEDGSMFLRALNDHGHLTYDLIT